MSDQFTTDGKVVSNNKSNGNMGIFSTVSYLNDRMKDIQRLEAQNKVLMEAVKFGYEMSCSGEYGYEDFFKAYKKCEEMDVKVE